MESNLKKSLRKKDDGYFKRAGKGTIKQYEEPHNTQKVNKNFPEIKKVTEYYSLTDREFKTAVMKFNALQAKKAIQ